MGEAAVCVEIPENGIMGNGSSPRNELKRDSQFLAGDIEADAFPNKKHTKEASNDDIRSEVSNPLVSPKGTASSLQDISSQPAQLTSADHVVCGEVSSTSLRSSSSEETLSDGERSGNDPSRTDSSQIENSGAVSTSQVVLEIPKHLSSSGIRKITFKFSKRKDDFNNLLSSSVSEPLMDSSSFGTNSVNINTCLKGSPDWSNRHACAPNMELRMSKKVILRNYPTNVKKLLSTGILDGARVKYISTPPVRELQGVIHAGGYLCGCTSCGFSKVLSAYEFEQHAGTKTRHPNNHIYLENGKPVYNIIQELKTAPLDALDEVIRNVAGSSLNGENFQLWKACFWQSNGMAEADRNHKIEHPSTSSLIRPNPYISNSVVKQKKTTEGGTKKRDNDLHRLLFMPNGLPDGTELAYYVKGQRILEGYKQGNGIFCSCCNREISPSQFEAHAGMAARRQPYRHIYTSTGLTLHDIATSLANGQQITTGGSDDMCTVCGDGGDLLFCGGCPRAFHKVCLNLDSIPEGDWHCTNCRDKSGPGRKASAGESSNIARPIIIRLTRVVKAPESEIGGCVVCRAHDFSVAKFDDRTVILCDQCEKEYHVGCLRDSGLCDLKEIPREKWFCCDGCSRIHVFLQSSVSTGAQLIPTSLSDIISRKHKEKGLFIDGVANCIQWRILSGKSRYPEHLPLLSRAAAIFRECFDPIVAKSGRDLIPVMVYG